MKTFSVKSKFVMVLALVLALFGGALLLFFGQSQKTVIRDAVAVDGPTNQEGYWSDEGRRASGFSGGTGYEDSPYQISSAEELAFLAYQVNEMGQTYAGRYFVLTDNIDLSEYYWQPIGMQYDRSGTAINRPFAGNFDGATYYIEGLYTPAVPDGVTDSTALRGYNNQGLFGYVYGYPFTIKNITIQNSFVQGYENVGAVAGYFGGNYAGNYDTINNYIQNCTVAADVNVMGDSNVGGVIGQVYYRSAVEGCVNNGQITASSDYVGGINGWSGGPISDCVNNGTITQNGAGSTGGIVGYLGNVDMSNCTNNGQIFVNSTAEGSAYIGGIAGQIGGSSVENCVNTTMGTISINASSFTGNYIGGVVGISNNSGTIISCNNQAEINVTISGGYIGGVAGSGAVSSSYNTGNITSNMGTVGGVVGNGESSNSYNSGSITGGTVMGGVIGTCGTTNTFAMGATNSYNSGELNANENTQYIGGVIGTSGYYSGTNTLTKIATSFNTGTINAENAVVGGIIGAMTMTGTNVDGHYISVNSFNVGQINGGSAVYGVVGAYTPTNTDSEIIIASSYYNNTDGQGAPLAAFPDATVFTGEGIYLSSLATQAKTEGFFTNTENWNLLNQWDFVITWAINPEVNDGYPSFNQSPVVYWTDDSIRANSFGGGTGTQEDPYLISNAQQLAYLAYMVNSGQGPYVESVEFSDGIYLKHFYQGVYFKQTQPIDLSEHFWPGIGVYDMTAMHLFAGNYDGGGFEITGMYAVGQLVAGLFGMVGNDPLPVVAPGTPGHEELSPITIENIVLVEPTVSAIGEESYSGGIIGMLYYAVDVTVQNCSVQGGFVSANDGSGGIVGMMAAMQSKIVNCQNSATVVGGGIVGMSEAMDGVNIVLNCINSGQVYGAGIILAGNGVNLINCINNGSIERAQYYSDFCAAGIAGDLESNSSVIGCVNNGQISGSATYAGGLVGELGMGRIINSYNTGDLNVSAQYAGGLVGYSPYTGYSATDNSIARSYNIGSVTNTKNVSSTSLIPYTAGILAYADGYMNISNCYNKGNITSLSENASSYTAGIIAASDTDSSTENGQYKNIYNTGTVTANSNIGGIIGYTRRYSTYNSCDLDNAFNTGNVVYNGSSDSAYIGGVAANAVNAADVANAYYGGACSSSVPAFGSGSGTNVSYLDNLDSLAKTEEWFTTETNWDSTSQWDFEGTWAITEGENDGYPVLIELDWWINTENVASSFAGGSGTEEDPYLIETPAQLAYLSFAVYYGLGPTQAIDNYANVTYANTYFKQTANIDLSGHLWLPIGAQFGVYGEESANTFGGNYDGDGFYITGMTFATSMTSNGYPIGGPYGVFGNFYSSSEQPTQVIENMVIGNPEADFTIQAPGLVGGVVGVTGINVTIRNCTNYANITATMDAGDYGGIVGYPYGGNIIGCTNYGTITGAGSIGGIAGGAAPIGHPTEITNSYNYGNIVSNGSYVGGIAGLAIVSDCINYATVSGTVNVGGVVGYGTASTSANHGDVSGQTNVGGVVGHATLGLSYDCFNTGSVTGQTGVGGVVGELYYSLYRCYSTGAVSGTENVGGVIGLIKSSESYVVNNFAVGSISGTTNVGGVVGNSQGNNHIGTNHYGGSIPSSIPFIGNSTQINDDAYIADLDEKAKQQSFFEDYDVWDGIYIWDFAKVWTFKTGENDGYPVFSDVQTWIDAGIRGTSFGGGSGTQDDPYIISSAQELAYLSYMIYTSQAPYTTEKVSIFSFPFFYQDTYFKQTADIDLSAYYWSPIGASLNATTTTIGNIFAGHYDGGGYTISGLKTLNGPSLEYANQALFGLFGPANYPASISNVILENTDITGRMTVAGLVGTVINSDAGNTATISNCHHYGNLYLGNYEAANNVGGIVGINFDVAGNLVLENCSNAGNIDVANEQANAGGVVGHWTGNLSATNIQSFASISGGQNVGAFAGALNLSAYLSADKTVTVETALLTGTLSGTNVGGFAGSIETQTTATSNTVTVSRVGYEVDIISATTAGVIAPSISGSNISFANSYAIIDASQTSISQFITQAEGMTQDSSLYYVETASGENRYYAGNDFSDFVWVDDSPCPIMADFVWMGEDLLRIYYETYGEGYMTNLITSSSSGWQAIA